MSVSVAITSVNRLGPQGIKVSGTGSPDGATVTVQIQINGGGTGTNPCQVTNAQWSTTVPIQSNSGQTATVTATAVSSGVSAQDVKNVTL